ncbi:sugar kinase [Fictibacillus sp. KIGAM418]|uniref:Sugar kinase n=1 Tax=Fictibacillus marinisediminis TaxID=2878389 RepID=A0A9X1XE80_9BACL|nr:sugar kinase [Fictibacillus marinisediminis]MCK6258873.1 sugar kinase [Fictibacillus marinisediminis]
MDVVTFGETMVLFHPSSAVPLRFAGQFEKTIGGAESNVAIALSRLGHQAGWISRLGNDDFGIYVRNFIRGEGVDTSRVVFDQTRSTAIFFKGKRTEQEPKVYYYRSGSAASRMSPEDLDEDYLSKAKYLHLTGITPALSDSCRDLVFHAIAMAKRHGVMVVFDPNIRLKLWSKEQAKETLIEIASRCDIVLPGIEEGILMTGKSQPEEVARMLLKNGSKAVVVKLGAEGAYYDNGSERGYIEGFPVSRMVDPIGAGDGFAAGFLSGLLRGWTYQEAVRLGNRVGAYAVTVSGDVEGYPYFEQIIRDNEEIPR